MAKRNQYWLLLLAMVLTVSLILTPGSAHAHYYNTAVWNTMIFPTEANAASNCLVKGGRQIILLGDLPETGKPYDFTLEGTPGTAAPIYWYVDEAAAPYLDAFLYIGDTPLSGGQVLTIPESGKLKLTLFLTPVTTRAHETIPASITVEWGDLESGGMLLGGTFQTTLQEEQAAVMAIAEGVSFTEEAAEILLSDLTPEGLSVDIVLTSDKELAQALSWSLDEAAADFVEVTMTVNGQPVRNGADVKIPYDAMEKTTVPVTVTMTLMPTVQTVHEAIPTAVTVTWGSLSGIFTTNVPELAVHSDTLMPKGTMVTLDPLTEGRELQFTLSALADTTAPLTWTVETPHLNVTMAMGDVPLTSGGEVTVAAGETVTVTMTLTPGTEAREATDATIQVAWGELLSGTFATSLEAVTETPDPTEPDPSEPEETEPEATEPDPTEPEATEPEATEPETTEPEPTENSTGSPMTTTETEEPTEGETTPADPTEPTEGETTPTEPQEPADPTDPSEPTDPVEVSDPTEPSEPAEPSDPTDPSEPVEVSDPTDPTDPAEPSDPTDPTEPEVSDDVTVTMTTLGHFTSQGLIPVELTVSSNAEHILLSLAASPEEASPLGLLPPFTRYTLDGETYYLMYNGGSIFLKTEDLPQPPVPEGTEPPATMTVLLFLDVSGTDLRSKADLILVAQASRMSGGADAVNLAEARSVLHLAMGDDLTQAMILTDTAPLNLNLPESWKMLTPEHTLTAIRVEEGDDVAPFLASYDVSADQIQVTRVAMDSQPHVMTLRIGTDLPPAGTYLLSLKWYYQGVCIHETQITFFVNYPVNTVPEETGGADL